MVNTPWKLIGFEKWLNESGEECVRLFVERALSLEEGHTGEGMETQRFYFKTKYVNYEPQIGHIIIPVDGRYGLTQIMVIRSDPVKPGKNAPA